MSEATAPRWLEAIERDGRVEEIGRFAEAGGSASVRGVAGSSTVVLAAMLQRRLKRPMLLLVAHLDEAEEAVDELGDLGVPARIFPALE
ncbi:MAG: hypothetical protein RJA16_1718, partial [Planctomycetota bacterium]